MAIKHKTLTEKINLKKSAAILKVGLAGLTAVVAAYIGIALLQNSNAAVYTETPVQAEAFLASVGINAHMDRGGSYGSEQLVDVVKDIGFRKVRGSWGPTNSAAEDRAKRLRRDNGTQFIFWTGQIGSDINARKEAVKRTNAAQPGTIIAVEGPNEQDCDTRLPAYVKSYSEAYRNDPATKNLLIYGPSFANVNSDKPYKCLGDVSQWIDVVNMHDYPGNEMKHDTYMDRILNVYAPINAPGKKVVSTETCYTTHNLGLGGSYPGIPEKEAGIHTVRLYLEHFRRGFLETYCYQLFTDNGGQHAVGSFEGEFGIVRDNGAYKPAATGVKNMIALLSDKGPSHSVAPLSYTLAGENAKTRKVLMQKRDGTYWLAIWQQEEIWDRWNQKALYPANASVTITLPKEASAIRTYMPNRGANVIKSASNTNNFTFESSEEVTLIQIGGVAAAPNPTQNPTPTPGTGGQYDLLVTNISPITTTVNQPVQFQATIKNQGTGTTPSGTIHGVAFRVNGQLVSWNDVHTTSLAPGASVTLTATGGPTSSSWTPTTTGSVTVEAFVDDINRISNESNESNNKMTATVTVGTQNTTKPGDVTGDGKIDIYDLNLIVSSWGRTDKPAADANANGKVDIYDLNLVITNWGGLL